MCVRSLCAHVQPSVDITNDQRTGRQRYSIDQLRTKVRCVPSANRVCYLTAECRGDFFLLNAVDRVIRVFETKTGNLINVFQDLVNRYVPTSLLR